MPAAAAPDDHNTDTSTTNTVRQRWANDNKTTNDTKPVVKGVTNTILRLNPYTDKLWWWHLFVHEKFMWHRFGGLLFILQYITSWYIYIKNYESYKDSPLVWSLPLTGVLQSLSATYYFQRHLPKQNDPGYYSDSSALSYNFVAENIFFSSILLWQFLYYSPHLYPWFVSTIPGNIIEAFFVFLPYTARGLFPKTSFRDSINNDKNKSVTNYTFFYYGTWITKIFYVWAKFFIGFFLNYVRFIDYITTSHQQEMYRLLLFSSFATTISMFLHTLKFKGYIGPKTAFSIYVISYMATFYSIIQISDVFFTSWKLVIITTIAMVLNFGPRWIGFLWQFITLGLLYSVRLGYLPITL